MCEALAAFDWPELERESAVTRAEMEEAARIYAASPATIACWAMGITQHAHGVANVREIANLLLLGGNIGRPGAGACPVRGHSNVQGDRTMGIWEKPRPEFLDKLGETFGFQPPRRHGMDTVAALEAMLAGRVRVLFAMGGNFAAATPDSERSHQALARCRMTAHVATKLNRSHVTPGTVALLLPCLGRTERDVQAGGEQFVTVEDSMSMVHASRGNLAPASEQLLSEPAIVAGLARATLGGRGDVDWEAMVADYGRIREAIEAVIPGFERFNERVHEPGGFRLPNGARDRDFRTEVGKARFTVNVLPRRELADDQLLLMTMRSHDQFNTTVYGLDDRYRGVFGEREVVFVHPDDIAGLELADTERVDITSHFDGTVRTVRGFRLVPYDIPRGCAAAYFPEANPLVPLESFAEGSRTPAYKSVVVTLARAEEP
jgi:molybdopterin-dependent oxidoreductase alpha subunit